MDRQTNGEFRLFGNERGHQKPVLSGLIIVLGMLVASAMMGVFYLVGTGQFSSRTIPTNGAKLPRVPSDWPVYKAKHVSLAYPPGATVKPPTLGHRRQMKSRARGYGYRFIASHRVENSDGDLLATVTVGQRTDDRGRSEYYQYRRSVREGNEGLTIRKMNLNARPVLWFDRRGETVNTGTETRSIDVLIVTKNGQYVEASTGLYSDDIAGKVRAFKQIISSLELQ